MLVPLWNKPREATRYFRNDDAALNYRFYFLFSGEIWPRAAGQQWKNEIRFFFLSTAFVIVIFRAHLNLMNK